MNNFNFFFNTKVDINVQTDFGNSVLHLASHRNLISNIRFLNYLLTRCQEIVINQRNKDGENFLHTFMLRGLDEEANEFLRDLIGGKFKNCPSSLVKHMFNEKDTYGHTPFFLCVDSPEIKTETIQVLVDHGVDINIQNNLGYTALHRVVALSLSNCLEIVSVLLKAAVDVTAIDVHGQTSLFMVQNCETCRMLLDAGSDVNVKDRSGRSPLAAIINLCNTEIVEMLLKQGSFPNAKDNNGATALHYAAHCGDVPVIKTLLQHGADVNINDNSGRTPLSISMLFCYKDISDFLQKGIEKPKKIEVQYVDQMQILQDLPKCIKFEDYERGNENVVPEGLNKKSFFASVLRMHGIGLVNMTDGEGEGGEVLNAVSDLVTVLCDKIMVLDKRFKLSILPTGSASEGTKVGLPDEFDFVVCIDSFAENFQIIEKQEDILAGFTSLEIKPDVNKACFLPFCDRYQRLDGHSVLRVLFRLFRRGLLDKDTWADNRLIYRGEQDLKDLTNKPVFNIDLLWTGKLYTHLCISVDLVPGIRQRNWWPKWIECPLELSDDIRSEGFLILLQSRNSSNADLINCGMDDLIDVHDTDDEPRTQQSLLRISCAPIEIALMKQMPITFRMAYALGKIVTKTCPDLLISDNAEKKAFELLGIQRKDILGLDTVTIKPKNTVSSYMLKSSLFHKWSDDTDPQNEDVLSLTVQIFKKLFYFSMVNYLPTYVQNINIFTFEFSEINCDEETNMHAYVLADCNRRDKILRVILGMLGERVTEEDELKHRRIKRLLLSTLREITDDNTN